MSGKGKEDAKGGPGPQGGRRPVSAGERERRAAWQKAYRAAKGTDAAFQEKEKKRGMVRPQDLSSIWLFALRYLLCC
jgi:hypothetical protein